MLSSPLPSFLPPFFVWLTFVFISGGLQLSYKQSKHSEYHALVASGVLQDVSPASTTPSKPQPVEVDIPAIAEVVASTLKGSIVAEMSDIIIPAVYDIVQTTIVTTMRNLAQCVHSYTLTSNSSANIRPPLSVVQ